MQARPITITCALAFVAVLALLIMIIPPPITAAPPQDDPSIYYVQPGDTLFSISRRFGTTVGAIMSAKALLGRNPEPSRAEIEEVLSGNLCRCTGYHKIVEAVESVKKD